MASEPLDLTAPTRERILAAAETLFISKGVGATTIRAVTQAAGVNVGAVNYHFGSRTGLIRAITEAHVAPLAEASLRELARLEESPDPPDLEAVLTAFLGPILEGVPEDPVLRGAFELLWTDPETVQQVRIHAIGEVDLHFHAAIVRALPEMTLAQALRRLDVASGVILREITLRATGAGQRLSIPELISFVAAGMRGMRSEQD